MVMNDYCARETTATVCEQPRNTMKATMQETKNMLAELLVMMGDTNEQLFGDNVIKDSQIKLECNCFEDEIRTVNEQVRLALSSLNDMRRRIL